MKKFRYIDKEENSADPFAVPAQDESHSEFASLLESETHLPKGGRYQVGDEVSGKVLSAGASGSLFIDLGSKSPASIAVSEFVSAGLPIPKVGETVSAFVTNDNGSEVILSKTLSQHDVDDNALKKAFHAQIPVQAKVEKVIKGGFEALLGSRRCFVPLSHMELSHSEDPEKHIGNTYSFLITELKGRNNPVLSRRAILREEFESRLASALEHLTVGQTRRATITRLVDFGAFASLEGEGIEGLIPLGEMSWKRIKKADEAVHLGDLVNVKVIRIETSPKIKIALSIKEAGEDPWVSLATQLVPGASFSGTVVNFIDQGAFVSVADGVEGFVPVSHITWEKRLKHPKEALKIGDKINAYVLTADIAAHRLSLSIKGPMPESLAQKFRSRRNDSSVALTQEEKEQMTRWEEYQATEGKMFERSAPADSGIFAEAFQKATKKKR